MTYEVCDSCCQTLRNGLPRFYVKPKGKKCPRCGYHGLQGKLAWGWPLRLRFHAGEEHVVIPNGTANGLHRRIPDPATVPLEGVWTNLGQ